MRRQKKISNMKVWRCTLERCDSDTEMVRVEMVPLSKTENPETFEKKLVKTKKEKLRWWDINCAKSKEMSLNKFKAKLGLKPDEKVFENMVFWLILKNNKLLRTVHATPAARELSKDLYSRLTRVAPKASNPNRKSGGNHEE